MLTVTIDGVEVEVEAGATVLQACEQAGKEIPRFCYHDRLNIAGNCRMCLVEMENSPKPIASCAMPIGDGMVIHTNTPQVRKAREGVMEFLLINHPLDCPICDQGGECDLQDQAMAYGLDHSRYRENKRAVKDKDLGPLVKTVMTRCIHCTRCIRFATEIAGVEELGALGRGEHMEISNYIERALTSELSGNIIDLCPVGALTSKPYAFTARSWELNTTETIDAHDAVGSNIRVDSRGRSVLRVLPRLHEDVNEEWLSDKARFANDGLRRQRLDRPYIRCDGRLQPSTWDDAFSAIADRLKATNGDRIAAIAGDMACAESMIALKDLMTALGSPHVDCRQDGAKLETEVRASYLFNTTIAGIEDADACLLIGTNPRWEAALVNARLRKRYLAGGFRILSVGPELDLTIPVETLGGGPDALAALADGSLSSSAVLSNVERPMLILGQGALARFDGSAILGAARCIAERCNMVQDGWNGFNVLHTAAARVAGLDLGMVPEQGGRDVSGILEGAGNGDLDAVFLLGADEINTSDLGDAFVIYLGHHGDAGANRADVVLPGAAYVEKNATWVNTEGRAQLGQRAVFPPGDAREDWAVVRALSEVVGHTLPYDDLASVRARLAEIAPLLGSPDEIGPATWGAFGTDGAMNSDPFASPVSDFYMTNAICRASETMAACSAQILGAGPRDTGTHG
ncbi:MAG: NADH-quinone oxidoreductase subunit G [Alphaproteobacteria bacterium]|nr:NADH-quinone oxidoreductase subunit G [Alphaproteobacteria bacterium]MCY4498353.1 NADH-quinone oxidoreductase subunit NuoG [Rhodospirillaceae bacterium]